MEKASENEMELRFMGSYRVSGLGFSRGPAVQVNESAKEYTFPKPKTLNHIRDLKWN